MSRVIDICGQRFGSWLILGRAASRTGEATWHCLCDCGTEAVRRGSALRDGRTRSCGCARKMDLTADITYGAAHMRVRRARGPASSHACVGCGTAATNWSYNHGEALYEQEQAMKGSDGNVSVLRYHPNPAYYSPRCYTCHRAFDTEQVHWDLETDRILGRQSRQSQQPAND